MNLALHGLAVRVRVRIWMLDHSAWRGCLHNAPNAVLLLQLVGNLHRSVRWSTALGAEAHIRAGLIIVDSDAAEICVHCLEVQGAKRNKMLAHCGANGFIVALLLFAASEQRQNNKTQDSCRFREWLALRGNSHAIYSNARGPKPPHLRQPALYSSRQLSRNST